MKSVLLIIAATSFVFSAQASVCGQRASGKLDDKNTSDRWAYFLNEKTEAAPVRANQVVSGHAVVESAAAKKK